MSFSLTQIFQELFQEKDYLEISGPVKFIHQYVNMPEAKVKIELENRTQTQVI